MLPSLHHICRRHATPLSHLAAARGRRRAVGRDPDTMALFNACASPRDEDDPEGERLYYNSPTNEELQANFEEIASELSRLRIAE